jgi:hypothetical protein
MELFMAALSSIHTDLDGNLSFTLNPFTASKLDHYLLTLFQGLSEITEEGSIFDQHILNEKGKDKFIDNIKDTALFAKMIPLFIFTHLFHQRFVKHSFWNRHLKYYISSL